jgi:hypothetical protein
MYNAVSVPTPVLPHFRLTNVRPRSASYSTPTLSPMGLQIALPPVPGIQQAKTYLCFGQQEKLVQKGWTF